MPVSSPKFKEQEAALPEPLRPVYKQMIEEYEFLTTISTGRGYVAYAIIADMVRAGWRPSAERTPDSKL